ncbi:hypothetical protein FRC10_003884 [Ceratobasidium sp. 414]|nr:hypothetical protein FRC10_003884 [Ceratobasidium sp. 414]
MGFQRWRHLMVAVMRRHLLTLEADEEGEAANSVYDMQAAHTTQLANALYAIKTSEWHLMTSTAVAKFMHASRCCQEWMLAKVRGVTPAHPEHGGGGGGGGGGEGAGAGPLADKGKGKAVEQSPKGEEEQLSALRGLEKRMSERIQALSQSTLKKMEEMVQAAGTPKLGLKGPALERSHPLHLSMLRALLGDPQAQFKGDHQGVALATVAARRAHLLAVLPTGQGKSVLFMAPAKMEPMVTVVVVPLVALKMDLVVRAREAGVECSEWRHGLLQDRGLVLLSAETAGFDTFRDWLLLQLNKGKLARVCVDEAHLLLTSVHYRPMLGVLSGLGSVGVPLLLTTATLPPDLEPHLKDALGVQTMAVVRAPTQRPEIQIHAALYRPGDDSKAVQWHARRYVEDLEAGEVVLVQCASKDDAVKLSGSLQCPVLHADLDEQEKLLVLQGWQSGRYKCITATSALGVGVHHARCRAVLGLGCYGLVELSQESGRAGHDGEPALSVTFFSLPFPQAKPSVDFSGYQPLKEMLQDGRSCRRLKISAHLDGQELARSCTDMAGAALCDNCQSESEWLASQAQPLWRIPSRAYLPTALRERPNELVAALPRRVQRAQTLQPEPHAPPPTPSSSSRAQKVPGVSQVAASTAGPLTLSLPALLPSSSPPPPPTPLRPSTSAEPLPLPPLFPSQPSSALDPVEHGGFSLEKLKGAMNRLKGACVFCHFSGLPHSHPIEDCLSTPGAGAPRSLSHLGDDGAGLEHTKADLHTIPWGMGCYTCWYPVRQWHPKLIKGQVTCNMPDQLPQLAWLVHYTPEARRRFEDYFGQRFDRARDMFLWCQAKAQRQPSNINVHLLLVWYMEKLKGVKL